MIAAIICTLIVITVALFLFDYQNWYKWPWDVVKLVLRKTIFGE